MLCAIRTCVSADANLWFKGLHVCMDYLSRHGSHKVLEQEECSLSSSLQCAYEILFGDPKHLWLSVAAMQPGSSLWVYECIIPLP